MKILFVWTGVTSYMANCWRRLQSADGVELRVVVETADSGKDFAAKRTFAGLDVTIVDRNDTAERWRTPLRDKWLPDVVFAGGWRSPTTRRIVAALPDIPKVFCLDMPWRWSLRCFAAKFLLRPFLRRFAAAFVPGAKSRRYARWLGFAHNKIYDHLYSVDVVGLRSAASSGSRKQRRGFLYVGRYSSEKRVDLVNAAHARYKELGGTWSLDCYGQGGIFVQADEMPSIYAEHACLLLASSFDPWPLVMLEAKASGMDIIASDRCGNCDELGAVKVPYGDVDAMARSMLLAEENRNASEYENRALDLLEYDCSTWTRRVIGICSDMLREDFFCAGMDDVANGMATVARRLADDTRFAGEYIVHGAWLPRVWMHCLARLFHRNGYIRMSHGAYSPVYLEGSLKKRLVRQIERFFLRHAKKVIVTCDAERTWVEAYEPKARTELVDLREFDWSPTGSLHPSSPVHPPTSFHVLYMGRRHPLKGLQYLEEAVRNLPGNVELKVVSNARGGEKEAAFAWSDVVCLPSLSENFGIVVAEALARGKPVVATDGAPAWKDEPRTAADGSVRLVYVEGYRDATPEIRVRLLKDALLGFTRP